jgi:DNA polymerase-3 subunit gamma/tau
MAHRALTLKYRPQVFPDMVGQDHVSRVLERALESGRIAHAYLFTGARGVGKTTAARILAKALNCQTRAAGKGRGADPCNACTSCLEITSGVSLDVAEIDGASNRGIADVQALREKVRFAPTGGKYRVVIIDEVHQLSNDAFAALLKTLEEPPPHLVFIFATTDPQKLPDTIRSRTQRYDFARVPIRKVADRLIEIQKREAADPEGVKFTLTDGAALLMAHKAEGSLRDAVSALDQVVSSGEPDLDEALVRRVLGIADREAFFDIAEAIVKRDPREALRAVHRAFEKGLDARDLAEGLGEHVRHILVLKVDPEGADLVAASAEDVARLRAQGEGWSENDLLRLLRIASDVLGPLRDSPQPLVHLEAAILQMATLEPGETLAELLERLEALERRLGSAGESGAGLARASGPAAPGRAASPPPPARVAAPPPRAASPAPGVAAPEGPSPAAGPPPAPGPTPSAPPRAAGPVLAPGGTPSPGARSTTGPSLAGVPRLDRMASGPVPAARSRASLESADAATAQAPAGAAPAAAVAVQDEPIVRDAESEQRWREVIAAVNKRKRLLGAFLEESIFVGRAGAELVVAMDDLHGAVVEEKDNRALLAEEVRSVFGEDAVMRCAPLAAAGDLARGPSPEQTQAMVQRTLLWFRSEAVPPKERKGERTNG